MRRLKAVGKLYGRLSPPECEKANTRSEYCAVTFFLIVEFFNDAACTVIIHIKTVVIIYRLDKVLCATLHALNLLCV
jgi:hypothetical protein